MAESTNQDRRAQRPAWLVPVVVIAIAGALIAVVLSLGGGSDSADRTVAADTPRDGAVGTDPGDAGSVDDGEANPVLSEVERRDPDDPRAVGDPDAPVVLVMFSDYQCPYCARWNADTLPAMMTHVDAGDLRIEFRDINVFGPESERSARAALAAGEQGAYLDYHSALFAGGDTRSVGDLSDEALVGLAGELGLDTDRFATDMTSDGIADSLAETQAVANRLGVMATPSFLMAGEPIRGAQPTDVFEQAFAAALERVGG